MRKNNKNLYFSIKEFAKLTSKSPMIIHLNPSGLIRLGNNNENRFEEFRRFVVSVENLGGNILIPTFSYSFVGEESVFDVYKDAELPLIWTNELKETCYKFGIDYFYTIRIFR